MENNNLSEIDTIKDTLSKLNVCTNTQTGDIYIGGLSNKNLLHKDDKGYFIIESYGKFMGKRYPIKKHFTDPKEVEAIDYFLNK